MKQWGLKMQEYIEKLVEQFKSATGTKKVDINSQKFIEEFNKWIKVREIIGKEYTSFIDYMETYPNVISEESVEIGKGEYDSIALDTKVNMITSYSKGINKTSGEIIDADFEIYEGTPLIIRHGKSKKQIDVVNTQYIRRFITHNPYDQSCIKNWEQLHNIGENITIGAFGNIYDKDIKQKIKQIKLLRDNLINDYFKEDYVTDGDKYYYAISSNRKVKKLVKEFTK